MVFDGDTNATTISSMCDPTGDSSGNFREDYPDGLHCMDEVLCDPLPGEPYNR